MNLAVKILNTLIRKTDSKITDLITPKQLTVNEILKLDDDNHPDIKWMKDLFENSEY